MTNKIKSLLPRNATDLEYDLEETIRVALDELPIQSIKTLKNPWECPIEFLPWLASEFSVDEWDSEWPEEKQRAVVADSLEIHRHKGPVWAVKRALALADAENAVLTEWFQQGGSGIPGTFWITLPASHPALATKQAQRTIQKLVNAAKSVSRQRRLIAHEDMSMDVWRQPQGSIMGDGRDTKEPKFMFQFNMDIPSPSLLLTAHAKQNKPLPTHFAGNNPTPTFSLFATNCRENKPVTCGCLSVFKREIPEGELSPGGVTWQAFGNLALRTALFSQGNNETAKIYIESTGAIPAPTFLLNAIGKQTKPLSTCFSGSFKTQGGFLSRNASTRIEITGDHTNVFTRQIPQGDIHPGGVTVNFSQNIKPHGSVLFQGRNTSVYSHFQSNKNTPAIAMIAVGRY